MLSETTESPALVAGDAVAPVEPRPSLSARLEATAPGRALLGFLQWAVVLGLIVTGFFGAEAINSGVELATRAEAPSTAHILAASAPRN
jgi:hypothetical protein